VTSCSGKTLCHVRSFKYFYLYRENSSIFLSHLIYIVQNNSLSFNRY
jgi:hypothetical protein